jgi:dienelactone hydrolase
MKGYLCKPAKGGKAAGVVVIHENRGLNPYIQDVARRLAAEGYVAFAPDALAPVGGYTGNEETSVAASRSSTRQAHRGPARRLSAARGAARVQRPHRRGGLLLRRRHGEHHGGEDPEARRRVPVLRPQVSAEDTAKIKAALLIHYAEADQRINAGWPAWEEALKKNNVRYTMRMYPGDAARFPQRHHAALRRGRRQARVAAHARLLRAAPARLRPGERWNPSRSASPARLLYPDAQRTFLPGKSVQYLEQSVANWVMSGEVLAFMIPELSLASPHFPKTLRIKHYVDALDGLLLQGGADMSPRRATARRRSTRCGPATRSATPTRSSSSTSSSRRASPCSASAAATR